MKKRKVKIKIKRPKRRIPVAPPGHRHETEKDYDRNKEKKRIKRIIEELRKVPPGKPGDFVHVPFVCHMYTPKITGAVVVTGSIVGPEFFEYNKK